LIGINIRPIQRGDPTSVNSKRFHDYPRRVIEIASCGCR
jgi:hypothetical protein